LKIAIVGCGKIADAHVGEIRKVPSTHLAAVCDLEPIMAEQLAVRFGVPKWYGNVEQMLEAERPDVLHITTPPGSHLPLTRQAVAAGCHVFLEKPMALRHADTQAIVDAVEAGGRKLTVNYWPNFESQALELKRLYAAGTLGRAVHVESHLGYNLAGDFGSAIKQDANHWVLRMPGKLFQNVLDHLLNKIVPFLDSDEPSIDAMAYCGGATAEESINGMLDELRVTVRGKLVTASVTFSAHARPVGHTLKVYGTKNTAMLDFNARTIVLERDQKFPSALGRLFPPFLVTKDHLGQAMKNLGRFRRAQSHYFDGMRSLLTEFYGCIERDSAPPIPYREFLLVSSMMDRIFQQVYPEAKA
jgi:predicted dehydrogenase